MNALCFNVSTFTLEFVWCYRHIFRKTVPPNVYTAPYSRHYEICYFPGGKTIHTLKFDVIKLMAWNLVNGAGFPSDAAYHTAVVA